MIIPDLLSRVTADAVVPEQVLPYVQSVAGSKPRMTGACVGYASEEEFVLVGYPLHDPLDERAMAEAVEEALHIPGLRRITVVGPFRPPQAPKTAHWEKDYYHILPVPPPPQGQKLRNLLRRAKRELAIEKGGGLGDDHHELMRQFLGGHSVSPGTRYIFSRLSRYLETSSSSLLLSGRLPDGRLAAFVVGEYASLMTAFFMFCFRAPQLAPPGAADLLLAGLLDEALERGQTRMNLGLGINAGIRFFKAKWGAAPSLPYVQVSWELPAPGLLHRVRGFFRL